MISDNPRYTLYCALLQFNLLPQSAKSPALARIFILRIGHRVFRDSRVTTHVCLTARALGADGVIIADQEDKVVESTVQDVTDRFGGPFEVQSGKPWKHAIKDWKVAGGRVVHLTAYGLPLPKVLPGIQNKDEDIL